jgi:hypothetical protein
MLSLPPFVLACRSSLIALRSSQYTDTDGVSETGSGIAKVNCDDCKAGKYQDREGMPSCIDCEIGKHQEDTGKESCDGCDAGETTLEVGQASCVTCLGGTVASTTDGLCEVCAAGKRQSADGECVTCSDGTKSTAGSSSCESCPEVRKEEARSESTSWLYRSAGEAGRGRVTFEGGNV